QVPKCRLTILTQFIAPRRGIVPGKDRFRSPFESRSELTVHDPLTACLPEGRFQVRNRLACIEPLACDHLDPRPDKVGISGEEFRQRPTSGDGVVAEGQKRLAVVVEAGGRNGSTFVSKGGANRFGGPCVPKTGLAIRCKRRGE